MCLLSIALLGAVASGCSGSSSGAPDSSSPGTSTTTSTPPDDLDSPSPGCSTTETTYPPGTTLGSIEASGSRSFRVHVPPGYIADRPTPVILMLHGGGGSGEQFQTRSSRMDLIADREGFVTVYPDGTGMLATWNGGLCCGRAVQDGVDDVAFMSALLDHLEGELCIDRRRVFATGMSNGAIMSHRLACELSERIAAIAPVAGTIGVTDCQPARRVPVMQIQGTDDRHVPWEGGVGCGPSGASFISVPDTMEGWRTRNGCDASSTEVFTEGNGRCMAHGGCEAPVVLCSIEGGGHSWPGGDPKANVVNCPGDGAQSQTFSASEAAWRFFAENPLP
ncbi:poly(3-hydroxybutyrate) depolymerase [Chondromyces crocatus]|uniref:Poly(3-hydroxybutyrate) depolymerase n=2 Tax=Chondromyces crocatus TaxID=52 RepID=A0A0K1EB77_CHOCO|nr:poly(3-hydroxybutyrate) depolymerase [Chondromyces crocatus]